MPLKLIMFSCTHAATLREPVMEFWFSRKRTHNIILTKQCNRNAMKCMLAVIDHCQFETAFSSVQFSSLHVISRNSLRTFAPKSFHVLEAPQSRKRAFTRNTSHRGGRRMLRILWMAGNVWGLCLHFRRRPGYIASRKIVAMHWTGYCNSEVSRPEQKLYIVPLNLVWNHRIKILQGFSIIACERLPEGSYRFSRPLLT